MIAFQYLQITSTLVAATHAPDLGPEIASCHRQTPQRLWTRDDECALHLRGDVHLLHGEPEEAEDDYRRALKAGSQQGAWSCRAAGLQAMFRLRVETALACLHRLREDAQAPAALKLEAVVLSALIFHEAGARALSRRLLLDAARDAMETGQPAWQALLRLIEADFDTRACVQELPDLADDIHWQSIGDDGRVQLPEGLAVDAGIAAPLIERRLAQLRLQRALVRGELRDSQSTQPVLQALGSHLCAAVRETVIVELAQAALAARQAALGEIFCSQLRAPMATARQVYTPAQRQQLYCLSRLRILQGRFDEGFTLYRTYAAAAMQLMREHQPLARRFAPAQPEAHAPVPADDISARLPARYRRAYQYMLAHLHRADLSIAEVAGAVGVTERALQLAFKEHVDVAPREVLRRLRMQKIRDELVQGEGDVQLMDVAMKFGVQNRTSLVSGYRKYFEETPSTTLTRRV
ncbi:MAG: helix-turn-helix transcriptional regulator [Burkholderiaceae bacterium]|nr:helix-turn-helix transcriptional regulator [Burkholderiaceae bacterium]